MRASDSSVGGAAGQFHTTPWAAVMISADGRIQSVSLALCDGLVGGMRP
jgi:hypothetical protein